jgi:hydrogenase-4 component B
MTLLLVAAALLLTGAGLCLLPLSNGTRGVASLLSQGIATALVLRAVLPVLFLGVAPLRGELPWSEPIGSLQAGVDPLGAFFLAWSLPLTWLGTLYATGYLRPYFSSRNAGPHFALLNLTSLAFIMVYTLENVTAFLLAWEIAAVSAWLLVIWDYGNQKIRFAGFNYLVSTHIGFFFLVAALMVMHSQTHTMTFASFSGFLRTPGTIRDVTFLLLVTSFGLKSAFFPFHTWLPRAHSAAPAHVSALMSGVIHKAGLFGLLRFTLLMGEPAPWMGRYLIGFSALSMLLGGLYTTSQRDLKRLLGYSSTENVGIAGIGFGLGYLGLSWHQPLLVALGFGGGLLHVLNHALFKCLLFYAAGAVYRSTHTVDLERLGGLARKIPWTAGFFLLGAVSIAALPPLNGFVSEFLIYAGLFSNAGPTGASQLLLVGTAGLLALTGGISALAFTRAFGLTFLGKPRDLGVQDQGEVSFSMRFTMGVHALGIVGVGLAPGLVLRGIAEPVRLFTTLLPEANEVGLAHAATVLRPISQVSVLLLAALFMLVALRWAMARRAPAAHHVTWGCGYGAASPRMQYTGTSFSSPLAELFSGVMPQLRREELPDGLFPQKAASLNTHTVDAVERRLFEWLGEGEALARKIVSRLTEEPRLAFALGLLFFCALVGGLALGGLP